MILQARLMKLLGPAFPKMPAIMRGVGPEKSVEEKEQANVAAIEGFGEIITWTEPEQLAALMKDLCETAEVLRPSELTVVLISTAT